MFACTRCYALYPQEGVPYCCPNCGGLFDQDRLSYQSGLADLEQGSGIWRYRHSFGLPRSVTEISLGEGNSPLIWSNVLGKKIAFKCEYTNPTGSFKDRGTALLVSFISSRGVDRVVEDSSGNAGASLAAYAAHVGIKAKIFIPEGASGPKVKQMQAYGAEMVTVSGERVNTTNRAQQEANAGTVYASHAYLPFNLAGYATISYEIIEQLGGPPGTFICPAGQGGLLLGAARGFAALCDAGVIRKMPTIIGVQAFVCSPLAQLFTDSALETVVSVEGSTIAEGVRISNPIRAKTVVKAVLSSEGYFIAVNESDILPGRDELAHRGFYVETTSAIVWSALLQVINRDAPRKLSEPIVVVLTGSGLKSP